MEDWANGNFVGKDQLETGYLNMQALAKVTVLDEVVETYFTLPEREGEQR